MAQPLQQLSLPPLGWSPRSTSQRAIAEPPRVVAPLEAACFEAHPDPQLVLSEDLEIVAANRAGRAFLERANGARALADSLAASAGEFARAVADAISAAIRLREPSRPLELSLAPPLSLTLRVAPLDPGFASALVTLRPHEEPRVVRSPRERFGFTPMESRVAELLCRRMRPAQIARELGISLETVRCHLKQAFVKARVHRQAELVAVMLGA